MTDSEPRDRSGPGSLAQEAIRRSLSRRQSTAETDVLRMIEVGRDLLSGGRKLRVADIVQAAGLSNDAFYRYFGSKEDFVAAVVEDGGNRLVLYMERKMAAADGPVDTVCAALDAVMSQASDPQVASATRTILATANSHQQRATGTRARLEARMSDLLAEPLTRLGSVDSARDARLVATMMMGLMENFLWSEQPPSHEDLRHILMFVQRAVSSPS